MEVQRFSQIATVGKYCSPCITENLIFLSVKTRPHCVKSLRRSRLRISQSASGTTTGIKESAPQAVESARIALLDAINGVRGRGRGASEKQKKDIADAVKILEADGGVPNPRKEGNPMAVHLTQAENELIEGRWQLMYTTRPGTASPIQRTFVGVDAFSVFQEIRLRGTDDPRVLNTVNFSQTFGELVVQAVAAVPSTTRIDFRFDKAAFSLKFWPYRVPYPVPFRLLGDKANGWLETTYLAPGGDLRISKGNKGTTFVLQKSPGPRQRLLLAVKSGRDVNQAVEEMVALNPTPSPASSPVLAGKWRLIWSSQASDANRLQKLTAGIATNWQIIDGEGSTLENLVEFLPGLRLRAGADTSVGSETRTEVQINRASLEIGSVKIALGIKGEGYVEQLYLDDKMRISRGNKGSTFIHVRDD